MATSFKMKRPEPTEYEWNVIEIGDGTMNLPTSKRWCLFEMWQAFPQRHKDGSIERIKAYGCILKNEGRKTVVHLPLYDQHVNVCKAARWKYVDVPMNCGLQKVIETGG